MSRDFQKGSYKPGSLSSRGPSYKPGPFPGGDDVEREDAIAALGDWLRDSRGSHFGVLLMDLIAKADTSNRARIAAGFPNHVRVFELWKNGVAG